MNHTGKLHGLHTLCNTCETKGGRESRSGVSPSNAYAGKMLIVQHQANKAASDQDCDDDDGDDDDGLC